MCAVASTKEIRTLGAELLMIRLFKICFNWLIILYKYLDKRRLILVSQIN